MDHLKISGAGNDHCGFDVGDAFARGSVRIIKERWANETLDESGRPTRQLRERCVIEGGLPAWNVVAAPFAYHSLPNRPSALWVFLNTLFSMLLRFLCSVIAAGLVLLALPLALALGYQLSGRTVGGGFIGIGVWAAGILILLGASRRL